MQPPPGEARPDFEKVVVYVIVKVVVKMTVKACVCSSVLAQGKLPERLQELEACGLPVTLVHGDYHPGNWRGVGNKLSVLDWGDCVVGHPLLDLPPVLRSISADDHDVLQQHWASCWQRKVPAADVLTAMTLIKPLAALRMAAVYQMFLDNIEASEQVYHRDDPLQMIERACAELDQIG